MSTNHWACRSKSLFALAVGYFQWLMVLAFFVILYQDDITIWKNVIHAFYIHYKFLSICEVDLKLLAYVGYQGSLRFVLWLYLWIKFYHDRLKVSIFFRWRLSYNCLTGWFLTSWIWCRWPKSEHFLLTVFYKSV